MAPEYLANAVEIPSATTEQLCKAARRANIDVVIAAWWRYKSKIPRLPNLKRYPTSDFSWVVEIFDHGDEKGSILQKQFCQLGRKHCPDRHLDYCEQ